jgi:hypothetical protein
VLAAGCAAEPADPPQISAPATAASVHQDARITLPVTVGIAFHHPDLSATSDRTEYAVLFTVQQAMRTMVQAEYSDGVRDAALAQYWSGAGRGAVDAQITQWISDRQQPVGMIVLEGTRYVRAAGGRTATVSFCADWSDVVRGETRTHVVGAQVQAKGARATYERLGLSRAADRHWRVDALALTPNSPACP